MKRTLTILGILAALLLLGTPAGAQVGCATGSTCTVYLTQSNTIQLEGAIVTLIIDNTGADTVLSFQLTTNPLSNTPLGIDQVGWNSGSVPTPPDDWSAFVPGQLDGFGSFQFQSADSAGTDGISAPLTFTLDGIVTTFAANANSNEFAVHVRFEATPPAGSCSGFIGGESEWSGSNSSTGCTPVPEPATLSLMGVGLVMLGGTLRKKLLRR